MALNGSKRELCHSTKTRLEPIVSLIRYIYTNPLWVGEIMVKRRKKTGVKKTRYRLIVGKTKETEKSTTAPITEDTCVPGLDDAISQEAFRRILKALGDNRIPTETDLPLIRDWCQAWSDLAAAEADIIERGEMVEKNQVAYDDGSMQDEETITTRNPSIAVRIDAERQIEIVGESLGLQPETLAQLSQNLSEKFMVVMSHTY